MDSMIRFNLPHLTGNELKYIEQAITDGRISGNQHFTEKCHSFFERKYGFQKTLLTTSCTDALEMSALLAEIEPGDEVIMPSFTFVSTANAFLLRGAKIKFADSSDLTPNISVDAIRSQITSKTKAIVVIHYAGIACDMDEIMTIAKKNELYVIEDAAQAIDAYYKDQPLGSFGHFATFSFHETKNVISGEGGLLVVNDQQHQKRAEIIWEKGTNRTAFFRGEVDKYGWIDIGSSFLPSDIIAAFLYAQLEQLDQIQYNRKFIWQYYNDQLTPLQTKGHLQLPTIPDYATNNGHLFYVKCKDESTRDTLMQYLQGNGIKAIFHYLPLHQSEYFQQFTKENISLPNAEHYSQTILRLPLYCDMARADQDYIINKIFNFFSC